jgi:hypothetical protein
LNLQKGQNHYVMKSLFLIARCDNLTSLKKREQVWHWYQRINCDMGCLPPSNLPSHPTLIPPKSLCLFDLSTWKAFVINVLVAVWLTASTDPPDFPNFIRRRRRRTKRRRVTENKIDHCGEQYGIEDDL